jgi:hypothetical protein
MAIKKDIVSRETPPLVDLGPILHIDPDQLEDRLKRMSDKDRQKLIRMLEDHVVVLQRGAP